MTGTPSISALALSRANNLADVASAQAGLANLGGVSAANRALAFYEPLFQSTGIFSNTSGGSFAVAGGGGLVAAVNGTLANGTIVLPKINDHTKPWRVNVRMTYNGDATNNTLVNCYNPADTSYGVFSCGFSGGNVTFGIGGEGDIISNDGCVNGQTYDFYLGCDGNMLHFGSIPVGRAGVMNGAVFGQWKAANETMYTRSVNYQIGSHTPPFQKTGAFTIGQASATNVIKGILFNQGGWGGGTDPRFQPPCICGMQVTRLDGVIDNTGTVFIPESYNGASQFDLAMLFHANNSNEYQGTTTGDPDAGVAFAALRAAGVATAYTRGDPSSYTSAYASPWGAPIGVNVQKQFYDAILNLCPGPGGLPGVRNLHLIGQSMGGATALNFAANYPQLPVRSVSGISAVANLAAAYAGSGGGFANSSIINGAFVTYYVSLAAGNVGNAVTNGTYWQQVAPAGGILPKPYANYTQRGTYSGGTTYALNDVVSVNATAATQSAFADPNFRASAFNNLSLAFWHGDSDTTIPISQLNTFVASMTSEGNTPTQTVVAGAGHLNASGLWNGSALLANIRAGNARAVPTALPIAIQGVTSNATALAGVVGEEISSTIAPGSAVSLTTDTAMNVTSISLTAGDWLIDGQVDYHPGATTTSSYFQQGSSTTTGRLDSQDTYSSEPLAIVTGGSIDFTSPIPSRRIHLAATTTVYLIAKAGFGVSTLSAYGTLYATRIR